MELINNFGSREIWLLSFFIFLYALYLLRVVITARKLGTGYGKIFIKVPLRALIFGLFIFALLGPSFGEMKKEVQSVGKDIIIAVDLSQSMHATDVQPTRLEKVKFELKNIVNAFSSDRIGLIIFSSEAFMQCPLTYDQNALNLFIETLHTGLVPGTGTNLAPPLQLALEKLSKEETTTTKPTSKIIVLISDGEDFGEERKEIVDEIEERGIRLFTLGVGTEEGSKILTSEGFKKDRQGNDVITKLNPTPLKTIARETDGEYFELGSNRNDVARLINTINEIEGELRDTRQVDVSANKYYYFLALALFLLLIDMVTSLKTVRI
ncbi:MAG: vWA domain-containing protein [Candidatus Cyclobacteriaceae bacterium M2_1C_046]